MYNNASTKILNNIVDIKLHNNLSLSTSFVGNNFLIFIRLTLINLIKIVIHNIYLSIYKYKLIYVH